MCFWNFNQLSNAYLVTIRYVLLIGLLISNPLKAERLDLIVTELNIEAEVEKVVVIEGPYDPFSVEILQNNKLIEKHNSTLEPFPFVVFHLPQNESTSQVFHIKVHSSQPIGDRMELKKTEFTDALSLNLFNSVKPANDFLQADALTRLIINEQPMALTHYLKCLALNDYFQDFAHGFKLTELDKIKPPLNNTTSHLRALFFDVRLAEKQQNILQALEQLTDLIIFYQQQALSKIYPQFKSIIKSKVASKFAEIEFTKLSPLLPNITSMCKIGFSDLISRGDQYKYLKQCFLDETYIELSETDNPTMLFNTLKSYWLYHNRLNEHEAAIIFLASAINIHTKQLNQISVSELYQMRGLSLGYVGKLADAIYSYHKAIDMIGATAPLNTHAELALSDNYYSLALVYLKTGELEKARRFIEKSLEIEKRLGNTTQYFVSYYALGKIEREMGNKALAKVIHTEVIQILNADSYHHLAAEIELIRDEISLKQFPEAEQQISRVCYGQQSKQMFEAQVIDCLLLKIELLIEAQQFEQAKFYINSTYTCMATSTCDNNLLLYVHSQPGFSSSVGKCDAEPQKNIPHTHYPIRQIQLAILSIESHSHCDKVVEQTYVNTQQFIAQITPQMSQAEAFISATQNLFDSYITALFLNASIDSNAKSKRVFAAIETYQNFTYAARLAAGLAPVITNEVEQQLTRLWQSKISYEKQLINTTIPHNSAALLYLKIDQLSEKLFTLLRSVTNPKNAKDISILTLELIIDELQEGQAIAHFFETEKTLFVVYNSRQESRFFALEKSAKLSNLFSKIETGVNTNSLLAILKNTFITDFLPESEVDLQNIDRLIVVTDGMLDAVPFNAFNMAKDANTYIPIAEYIKVVKANSASQYLAVAEVRENKSYDISVIADPVFGNTDTSGITADDIVQRNWLPRLPSLPHTRKEANQIAALFSNSKVNLLLGTEATNEALFSEQVRSSTVLHIATHGFLDEKYPDLSAFATSKKLGENQSSTDFVTMSELTQYQFHSDLVLLSGCETALGAYYNGVGIDGITQKFIHQGAGSVISSLWKIDDLPTALFMKHFYVALKENKGNSVNALYAAKRKFIHSGIYSNPKYWAGFVLTVANRQYEQINLQ